MQQVEPSPITVPDPRSTPGASKNRRKDLFCIVTLLLLTLLTWLPRLAGPLELRFDGGVYYTLGTSLYEGKGYRLLYEPGEIRDDQYPPLVPAIVALHQKVTGSRDPAVAGQALRITWALVDLFYAVGVFWFVRRYAGRPIAWAAAAITVLNPQSIFLSNMVSSDLPYAAVVLVFCLAIGRAARGPNMVAGAAAVAGYLTRTIGITLLAAWVFDALRTRRWRAVIVRSCVAAVPVIAWNAWVYNVEHGPDYSRPAYAYQRAEYMFYNVSYARNLKLKDPFEPWRGLNTPQDAIKRCVLSLHKFAMNAGETISSSPTYWHRQLDWIRRFTPRVTPTVFILGSLFALGALAFVGLVLLYRRAPALALFTVLSLMVIDFVPVPRQNPRYLMPLVPILTVSLILVLTQVHRWLAARYPAFGKVPLTAVVLACIVVQQAGSAWIFWNADSATVPAPAAFRAFYYDRSYRSLEDAQNWVRAHAPADGLTAVSMPHWMYWRTGLKAVMPPFVRDPAEAERLLDSVPVRYIILDDMDEQSAANGVTNYVTPAIERSPRWRHVYGFDGHCRVFERVRL